MQQLKKLFQLLKPYLVLIFLEGLFYTTISFLEHYRSSNEDISLFGIVYAFFCCMGIGMISFMLSAITYFKIINLFDSFVNKFYKLLFIIFLTAVYIYLFIYALTEIMDIAGLLGDLFLPLLIGSSLGICTYHYFINPETRIIFKEN